MDIEKARENFDKDEKLRCFDYNTYRHMAEKCQKLKKEQNTRKCYKCDKVEYIAKDCRLGQKMKNYSIQEESDDKKNNNQKGFDKGSEQVWYEGPL